MRQQGRPRLYQRCQPNEALRVLVRLDVLSRRATVYPPDWLVDLVYTVTLFLPSCVLVFLWEFLVSTSSSLLFFRGARRPRTLKPSVGVLFSCRKVIPQERPSRWIVEQIVDIPAPQNVAKIVEAVRISSCVCGNVHLIISLMFPFRKSLMRFSKLSTSFPGADTRGACCTSMSLGSGQLGPLSPTKYEMTLVGHQNPLAWEKCETALAGQRVKPAHSTLLGVSVIDTRLTT